VGLAWIWAYYKAHEFILGLRDRCFFLGSTPTPQLKKDPSLPPYFKYQIISPCISFAFFSFFGLPTEKKKKKKKSMSTPILQTSNFIYIRNDDGDIHG
jgi:hypothetical protein